MSRGLAPFAAAAALLLAGCEVYAVPDPYPCPGTPLGVFDFSGTQILEPLPTCYFAQPGSSTYQVNNPMNSFQGTIASEGAAAALCVGNAHAAISLGTRGGPDKPPDPLRIDVYYETDLSVAGCTCPSPAAVKASVCTCPTSSPTSNCSCLLHLQQYTTGLLIEATGRPGYSGFGGSMINTVSVPSFVPPALACDCLRSSATGTAALSCSYSYQLTATSVGTR